MRVDLHEVASGYLACMLDRAKAERLMVSLLGEIGLLRVRTAEDLRRLGEALQRRTDGGWLGGFIVMHSLAHAARQPS